MARAIFITATDTGAGKTWVTGHLLQHMLAQGLYAQALKPIASGVLSSGINEDVEVLLGVQQKLEQDINFHTYIRPVAPALAAQDEGSICPDALLGWIEQQRLQADVTLIEGVGGLMVPLIATSQQQWLVSDWLQAMVDVDVLLVVPLRLGCMNHLLLSCMLLAQLHCVPRWIVLNDVEQNGSGEETKQLLQPYLMRYFDKMPSIICVQQPSDLLDIV